MLKALSKPKRCPWCNSNLVAQIIHEINTLTPAVQQDLNDRKAVLGVHFSQEVNPKWQCMDCGAQIYRHDVTAQPDGGSESLTILPERQDSLNTRGRKKAH